MLLSKNNYTRRMQALLFALFAASLMVVLHDVGTERAWYWTYQWFDIIMHLLGGFSLGLLAALLYGGVRRSVLFALVTVLVLIIGWELFEVLFVGTEVGDTWYGVKTMKDVVVGLGSAYAAVLVYRKK